MCVNKNASCHAWNSLRISVSIAPIESKVGLVHLVTTPVDVLTQKFYIDMAHLQCKAIAGAGLGSMNQLLSSHFWLEWSVGQFLLVAASTLMSPPVIGLT